MSEYLWKERLVRIEPEAVSLARPSGKVHPAGADALKNGPQANGKSRGGWPTKMHLVAADARMAVTVSRSPSQAYAAPDGGKLLRHLGGQREQRSVLMDQAYAGDEPYQLALRLGRELVGPPLKPRRAPWAYDRERDRRRNAVERRFRRLQGVRRVFS